MQSAINNKSLTKNVGYGSLYQTAGFHGRSVGGSYVDAQETGQTSPSSDQINCITRNPLDVYGRPVNPFSNYAEAPNCPSQTGRNLLAQVDGARLSNLAQYSSDLVSHINTQKDTYKYGPSKEILDASRISLEQQYKGTTKQNQKDMLKLPKAVEKFTNEEPTVPTTLPCDVVIKCGMQVSREAAIASDPQCEHVNAEVDFRRCASVVKKESMTLPTVPVLVPVPAESSNKVIMGRI